MAVMSSLQRKYVVKDPDEFITRALSNRDPLRRPVSSVEEACIALQGLEMERYDES